MPHTALNTPSPNAGRVLVVDDSPVVREMLEALLSEHGFDVTTASSGAEALGIASAGFDLFVLDVNMPGMTGFELTERLRRQTQTHHVPILVLTTQDSTDDAVFGLQTGADDFQSKAVGDDELLARVRALVGLGRSRRRALRDPKLVFSTPREQTDEGPVRLLVTHPDPDLRLRLQHLPEYGLNARLELWRDGAQLPSPDERRESDLVLASFEQLEALADNPLGLAGTMVLTDAPGEWRADAFARGVEDVLPADRPLPELAARINSAARRLRRFASIEMAREQAVLAAISDPLTGLYNRSYVQEHLRSELARTRRYSTPLAVILLDLDHFKKVNDTHGHATGDAVLRQTASRLREATRTTDFIARYGGEEFVVLLPHTAPEQGLVVAEKIRQAMGSRPFDRAAEGKITVTVSQGLAFAPDDGLEPAALLDAADKALYRAKRTGRDRVCSTLDELKPGARRTTGQQLTPARIGATLRFLDEQLGQLRSSDLKSPLNAIRVASEVILRKIGPKDRLSSMVREVRGRTGDLDELLDTLQTRVRGLLQDMQHAGLPDLDDLSRDE